MTPAEVLQRLLHQGRVSAERSGLLTAADPPQAELGHAGVRFIRVPREHVDAEGYRRVADRIIAGRWSVFRCQIDVRDWNWNQDPKTGTTAPLISGKTLDYRDEKLVGDIKYLWEPNRHIHLVALAQTWALTEWRPYLDTIERQLSAWLEACPYLRGPNWSSSLELAIRLINWSIVWQLIGGLESPLFASASGAAFRDRWLESIYRHMHFVRTTPSTHSSANNHAIGESAGLFIAAETWPYWPSTRKWSATARRTLLREARLQTSEDGVHREQAIWYQHFVLDFLLLAGLASRAADASFPDSYWRRIQRMIEFLAALTDSRGHVPMIGDADDGYVTRLASRDDFDPFRSLIATGARLFADEALEAKSGPLDEKTAWLVEIEPRPLNGHASAAAPATAATAPASAPATESAGARSRTSARALPKAFGEGGYFVLGADFAAAREIKAIVDCGPLGYLSIAAHGHADALSLCLSVGGREFLIDPGTFAYHTEEAWRRYFRGTAAHNTVTVDECDQSIIAGSFMWREHAHAVCEEFEEDVERVRFRGRHDGYRRLQDPVTHRREIVYDKRSRSFLIDDVLECAGSHTADRWWHFSESCVVEQTPNGVRAHSGDSSISLACRDADVEWTSFRGSEAPISGWVSRRFDEKTATTSVRCRARVTAGRRLSTLIDCKPGSSISDAG